MRSCSGAGPQWCIRSGEWILDPTAGQWGAEPILVFREGSPEDWYGPGLEGLAEISEDEIVETFLDRVDRDTGRALLALGGVEHLFPAIWR
jgi:hypothetical protein